MKSKIKGIKNPAIAPVINIIGCGKTIYKKPTDKGMEIKRAKIIFIITLSLSLTGNTYT